MRKVWSMVVVAMLVALMLGVSAQAGGNGAMKVGLFIGYYPPAGGTSEIQDPPTLVGHVIFNATASGMMNVTIHLQDAEPNMTFEQVFLVPTGDWPIDGNYYSMTTNGQGKATLQFAVPMPEEPGYIKAIVREHGHEGVVYVTDRHDVNPKK